MTVRRLGLTTFSLVCAALAGGAAPAASATADTSPGATAGAAVANPASTVVALVAPTGSRLADEIRQELELAAFTVAATSRADGSRDAATEPRPPGGDEASLVVMVRDDERVITVLARAPRPGGVQTRIDLRLESDDRPTRRRACLTVVESLRVLGSATSTPNAAADMPPRATSMTGGNATAAAPRSTIAPAEPRAPPITVTIYDERAPQVRPRTMGVATTLDVFSAGSRPSGHLHFLWYFPLGPHLDLHARVRWPVVGAAFQSGDADVRMWTFGASLGLQYSFRGATAHWRPLLGVVLGNQMLLSDASSSSPTQSRSAVTPSAALGIIAGMRHTISRRAQLLWELEAARSRLVAAANRTDYEIATANAFSYHASVGVLFEY